MMYNGRKRRTPPGLQRSEGSDKKTGSSQAEGEGSESGEGVCLT